MLGSAFRSHRSLRSPTTDLGMVSFCALLKSGADRPARLPGHEMSQLGLKTLMPFARDASQIGASFSAMDDIADGPPRTRAISPAKSLPTLDAAQTFVSQR